MQITYSFVVAVFPYATQHSSTLRETETTKISLDSLRNPAAFVTDLCCICLFVVPEQIQSMCVCRNDGLTNSSAVAPETNQTVCARLS